MGIRCAQRVVVVNAASLVLVCGAVLCTATPASASPPGLASVAWSVSNNQASATGVTYGFNFTTTSTATITSVSMTVPPGTTGTPGIVKVVGLGPGMLGSLSSDTVIYTVTTPVNVDPSTPIEIVLNSFTNTATPGPYASQITTNTWGATVIATDTSSSVVFGGTGTAMTVDVAQSTTFTVDKTSISLALDPSLNSLKTVTTDVRMTVQTNAANGYTLSVQDNGGLTYSGHHIAAASGSANGPAFWAGANHFGYSAQTTGGSLCFDPGAVSFGGKYAGYNTAAEDLMCSSEPTGATAHSLTITNLVAIDYSTGGGQYTDTLTYTVNPNY